MDTRLDHIVIGAATLEQGIDYVSEWLGVAIPKGGEHPLMGTHNGLMRLGNHVFLEVLAVNPDAPAPERPRWYGLDDPFIRAHLKQRPRLLTWVVNTDDIAALQARTPFSFGEATPVSRGDLSWHFAIPDDGRLLAGGALPYLIQWHTENHPAQHMPDAGCRLLKLEIFHPYRQWLLPILAAINAAGLVAVHSLEQNTPPFVLAHLETPAGVKVLDSRRY